MKKIFLIIMLVFCVSCTIGCQQNQRTPLTVTFIDVSGANSADHTIKISFAEEKDYEDYYVDILVKSSIETNLVIFQEFAKEEDKVSLSVGKEYISLDEHKVFNLEQEQTDSMVGYGDALQTTIVVNSSKDATLTFLAVIGEKQEGQFKQIGIVSKEYTLKFNQKL